MNRSKSTASTAASSAFVHYQSGQCNCGKIQFELRQAPIVFACYCHCKSCSRIRSMSPVHLVCIPKDCFAITAGADSVMWLESGRHAICKHCAVGVFQDPSMRKDLRAVYPTTLRIEQGAKACQLPSEMRPMMHLNYENRLMDSQDDLPKYLVFPNSMRVQNDGTPFSNTE